MDKTEKEENSSLWLVNAILFGLLGIGSLLQFFTKPAEYLSPIDLVFGLIWCYLAIVFAYQYHSSKSGKGVKINNIKLAALILTAIIIAILAYFLAKPIIHSRLMAECEQIPSQTQYERNYCYSKAAIKTQDITICEKIQDQWIKEFCYFKLQSG